jgi:Na+/H+ antiporter NhaD/arsenite permease-like protein
MRLSWSNLLSAILLLALSFPSFAQTDVRPPSLTTSTAPVVAPHGSADVPLVWSLPFVLLLAGIALMPFVARHWWERHYPKVSVAFALLVAVYYFGVRHAPGPWLKEMREYASFIVLLGALYVISGGIAIRATRRATPAANAALLLLGAVLANVFGTTGAAMLLIRPYLRMNRGRVRPYHVVFFIFVVANVGGSLTPIGDPPLFLGYLKGVPFWWVLENMVGPWAMAVGVLVAVFTVIDWREWRRNAAGAVAEEAAAGRVEPEATVGGLHNFLFIGVVLFAVFRPSVFEVGLGGVWLSREVLMVGAAAASYRLTRPAVRAANEFTFGPIREVAILFVGIFSTMTPALEWLEHNAREKLPMRTPGQFYFASGTLSSVLDNAPTYLTFLQMRLSDIEPAHVEAAAEALAKMRGQAVLAFDPKTLPTEETAGAVQAMVKYHEADVRAGAFTRDQLQVAFLLGLPRLNLFLVAISAGSVFWGACTYIGNGPNFMVKSIADAAGAPTPGFLAYVYRYALPILVPLYVAVWAVFFRGG